MAARIIAATWLLIAMVATSALGPAPVRASSPPLPMAAHEVGQSYLFLGVYDDRLDVRLEITVADLEQALGFGWDATAGVSLSQMEDRLEAIRSYVEPRFALSTADGAMTPRFVGLDRRSIDIGDYVLLDYVIEGLDGIPDVVDVLYEVVFEVDAQHRNFLIIEHNWKTATFNNEANISLIFSPRSPVQSLDLTSSSVLSGFLGLVRLGVWHIWIGYDHILFLLALILPSVLVREGGKWRPVPRFRAAFVNIITIVTFFTLAHSVTLSLAGTEVVRLPSRLVESIIAASIAFAAWANLVPQFHIREWAIAFGFGLFHGFGFATVLGDIGVGQDHLVLSLFGFNLGVEVGQVAVVAVLFPVFFSLRKTNLYSWILRVGSWAFIAVALLWFTERAFDFNVPLVGLASETLSWLAGLFSGAA